jgi:hypothetical protein
MNSVAMYGAASGDRAHRRRRRAGRVPTALLALTALVLLLAGCGDDDDTATDTVDDESSTETSGTSTTATADSDEAAADGESTASSDASSTTSAGVTTSSALASLGQPAIWPAVGVTFATPEEAAADFVSTVLGVPPELGDFQQGDARSGEIEVFSPGEGEEATPVAKGLLLLRQLGPDDGWFVIAAVSENATIDGPSAAAEVPAGPVTVEGAARGFEATVVVRAYQAGNSDVVLDEVITQGGAFAETEPYSISVDLSGADPGEVVMVVVRGGTGLETDPGDFSAIPIVIAG